MVTVVTLYCLVSHGYCGYIILFGKPWLPWLQYIMWYCLILFQFLLHYLKSVYDWLDPVVKQNVPVATTAWAILRDSYHGDVCLSYSAEHIAVAVLFFALQCHGVEVPYSDTAEYEWWQVPLSLPHFPFIRGEVLPATSSPPSSSPAFLTSHLSFPRLLTVVKKTSRN